MANTDKNVKVIITGEDKTGPALASASRGFKGLSTDVSGLTKVLGGAALAGVGALGAFLYSAAKGAADAEVQIAKVTATLTSMGDEALKNKDAILEASQAAVKLGFDDEEAAVSITKFYQRTKDLTQAQELNNLAMDLARAKTIDLETATNLVSQALSGNGRVLAAYGISIKDAATPLEALRELQSAVGGQAEAFAGTFQGQMAILEESVSNLKDSIGGALLEAINPLLKELTTWAAKPETQQKFKEISAAVKELAQEWIPLLTDSFKILIGWATDVYNIMVKVGTAIIDAINGISTFVQKLDDSKFGRGAANGGGLIGGIKNVITGAKAEGGPVLGGNAYLVGERGPEIFSPSTSGFITPNNRIGGGSSIVINVTGNTLLDDSAGDRIARQIMTVLKGQIRI